MRKIEFCKDVAGKVTVRLDGQLVRGVSMDLKQVKALKKNRMWSPKVQEDYLKNVGKRMADEGLRADEQKTISAQFKQELESC